MSEELGLKKVLVAALILVAILVTLPFVEGFWVEKKYYSLNRLVSQRTSLKLEIIDYRRGWFSSTATVKVSYDDNNASAALIHFIVKERLHHGPVILHGNNSQDAFGKNLRFALALSEIHIQQPDLQLSSLAVYHFNGNVGLNIDCPTFIIPASKPGESMSLRGLRGEFSFSHHFKHNEGKIHLLSAIIPTENGQQLINNASYEYRLDKNGYELWNGDRTLTAESLVLNMGDKWQLKDLKIFLSDEVNEGELNSHLAFKTKDLSINDTAFGKQQFTLRLAKLNLDVFDQLGKQAMSLDQQGANTLLKSVELTPLGLQLISKGLRFNLSDAEFNTEWGTVSGHASLEMKKQQKPATQLQNLLANLYANATFKFPAKLLEDLLIMRYQALISPEQQQNPETSAQTTAKDNITRWVLAGWLIPLGNYYQVNLNYNKNKLLLNGKLMKLPNLPIPNGELNAQKPQR